MIIITILNKNKLKKASVIVFSPGPGSPKGLSSYMQKFIEEFKGKKKDNWYLFGFSTNIIL